ncbi:hypothetical protein KIN20_013139 [Parelaphostrongylus tenuis]|uniref:Uncharacterized protein n=1 Tax=Parelaphostrongylus tenuis TaxID=148309 RepID=A0AAD5QQT4_PARTN|nr:hypothetical protein KIN20_013139 [Parelaphostrongylus tenuis]
MGWNNHFSPYNGQVPSDHRLAPTFKYLWQVHMEKAGANLAYPASTRGKRDESTAEYVRHSISNRNHSELAMIN